MSPRLADHWVWDSWLIEDGVDYHLFFLRASRALHDLAGRRVADVLHRAFCDPIPVNLDGEQVRIAR